MKSPRGSVIIASRADAASINIAQKLINNHGFSPIQHENDKPAIYESREATLVIVDREGIYVQPDDLPLNPSTIIFASKHRSSTNTPALTVHATGNLTREAMYGGKPEEVSLVEPFRIRQALTTLDREAREANLQIDVTMEATHHGPTNFPVPICFVEIGSGPEQWSDPTLGLVAANAVVSAAASVQSSRPNAVGFGGTHYSDKLTRMCIESDFHIGHIVPRRAFDAGVSARVLQATFDKTIGLCKTAIVDWKGLKGEQRRTLLNQLSEWDIEVVKS